MAFDDELREMQRYIVSKLEDSGEFRHIEVGYKFSNPVLNAQSKRHILAVKKKGLRISSHLHKQYKGLSLLGV